MIPASHVVSHTRFPVFQGQGSFAYTLLLFVAPNLRESARSMTLFGGKYTGNKFARSRVAAPPNKRSLPDWSGAPHP